MSNPDRLSKEQVYYHVRLIIENWIKNYMENDKDYQAIVTANGITNLIDEYLVHSLAIKLAEYSYVLQDNR